MVSADDELRPINDRMETEEELTPAELQKKAYEESVTALLKDMKAEVENFGEAKHSFLLDFEGAAYASNDAVAE